MSLTLAQIFALNPITTNANNDLMYFSQSPYTPGHDAGMTFANFAAQFLRSTSINDVPHGGTGNNSFTAFSVITAGITSTSPFQNVLGLGTTGQVLTSQGAGFLPVWAAIGTGGGVTSIASGTGITLTPNPITTVGSVALTVPVTTILGGTGLTSPGTSGNVLTSNGTIWTSAAPAAAGSTVITDDTTTNATMFPTWVTANSGSLPIKVSSTKLSFNPSTATLTLAGAINGLTGKISAPTAIADSAGTNVLSFSYTPGSVAYLELRNNTPGFSAIGTNPNINITLNPKAGNIVLYDNTATTAPGILFYNSAITHFTLISANPLATSDLILNLPSVAPVAINTPMVCSPSGVLSFGTSIGGLTGTISAPTAIADSSGNNILNFAYIGSAVNNIQITNAPAASPVVGLQAIGASSAINFGFATKGGGVFNFQDTTGAATIRLFNAGNTHFTGLASAASSTADTIFTLPAVDGAANFPMVTNGSGILSFAAIAAGALPKFGGSGVSVISATTRDLSIASGTQTITGLGFQPSLVIFLANLGTNAATSIGVDNSSSVFSVYNNHNAVANAWNNTINFSLNIILSGANFQQGKITSFTSDGFVITWTKTGSPTGTATIGFLAFK